jgi:hypothetical protein
MAVPGGEAVGRDFDGGARAIRSYLTLFAEIRSNIVLFTTEVPGGEAVGRDFEGRMVFH